MTVNPNPSKVNRLSVDDLLLSFINAGKWEAPTMLHLASPTFKKWYAERKAELINAIKEDINAQ